MDDDKNSTSENMRILWGTFYNDIMNSISTSYGYSLYIKTKFDENTLTKEIVDRIVNLQQKNCVKAQSILKNYSILFTQSEKNPNCMADGSISAVKTLDYGVIYADAMESVLKLVGSTSDRKERLEKLFDLIKHGADYHTRYAALKLLDDEPMLREIALNADNGLIRKLTVQKLDDQDLLKKIATTDNDSGVKMAAIDKITDRDFIAAVAKNDPDGCVRVRALEKLRDVTMIEDCIKNDPEEFVRRQAGVLLGMIDKLS